jgi:uncharacterized protein YcfJ
MRLKLKHLGVIFALLSASFAQTESRPARSTTGKATTATLPAGTAIDVRINDPLGSDTSVDGDRFTGVLHTDVTNEVGAVVIPRGASVEGRVITAKPSGRLSSAGALELTINTIRSNGRVINVTTEPFVVQGKSHTKSNTTKIGGGAALGAIIGAVAGGGKGAAIGAGVGAAAGTAGAAATGKQEARVESEAVLKFLTASETRISSANASPERAAADRVPEEPVLRKRENTSADDSVPNAVPAKPENTPPANVFPDDKADFFSFSLRDKRVLRECLANSAVMAPASGTAIAKGGTLTSLQQRNAKALPLACDRELPAVPNDLERVVLGRQVLLLDQNGKVLDALDLR